MSGATPLGEFLRARREALKPRDVGLPEHGRTRVPGLRREEVALLAGVSPDCRMRLEQGRKNSPSAQVVDTLRAKSREFAGLWARHQVQGKTQQAKDLTHPEVGALEIRFSAFTVNEAPQLQLVVYQAEPASPTATAFAELRSREERKQSRRALSDN
ncbi:helix-turn-helix domain-containing protein [Streptomyces sp. NPDC005538]|uniref:MmyB family transcriptional regulator n=1 Tax=unclassified Streptomyces TaxID=2593676 RepID=UPI0033B92619